MNIPENLFPFMFLASFEEVLHWKVFGLLEDELKHQAWWSLRQYLNARADIKGAFTAGLYYDLERLKGVRLITEVSVGDANYIVFIKDKETR